MNDFEQGFEQGECGESGCILLVDEEAFGASDDCAVEFFHFMDTESDKFGVGELLRIDENDCAVMSDGKALEFDCDEGAISIPTACEFVEGAVAIAG